MVATEVEQVSPLMVYWILAIVIAVAAVYFILGIQVEATSAAEFAADPTQFTFVCPLGAYH
ncbi:MAG: hypothetical protein AAF902_10940 [Chloroflexota bacterium]